MRAADYNVRIQGGADSSGVVIDGAKHVMKPVDQIAMEGAVLLKRKRKVSGFAAVAIGYAKRVETLSGALVSVADSVIEVKEAVEMQPHTVAGGPAAVFRKQAASLLLSGRQDTDKDGNHAGQRTVSLLGVAQASFKSALGVSASTEASTCEVDAGLEALEVDPSAVVTTDLCLNELRYRKLSQIMKAKKNSFVVETLQSLAVMRAEELSTVKASVPPVGAEAMVVESTKGVVAVLSAKGVV